MKNRINIDNYEAFLLDYMEGNLNEESIAQLKHFSELHPELNIDLSELELVTLNEDELSFENKKQLKRSTQDLVSNEQFIAYIENIVTPSERKAIEGLCETHKELSKELSQYKKTISVHDTSIVYENKEELKKETKVLWLFSTQTISIAAALTLLFGLWMVFKFYTPIETVDQLSENKTTPVLSETPNASKNNSKEANVIENKTEIASNNNSVSKNISKKKAIISSVVTESASIASATTVTTNTTELANTVIPETDTNKPTLNKELEPALAQNKTTQPYIITQKAYDEDEVKLTSNEKKGFWSKAKKALNGLNKLGVKSVNGTEVSAANSEEYVLSLGNFSIQNNKYNQ